MKNRIKKKVNRRKGREAAAYCRGFAAGVVALSLQLAKVAVGMDGIQRAAERAKPRPPQTVGGHSISHGIIDVDILPGLKTRGFPSALDAPSGT